MGKMTRQKAIDYLKRKGELYEPRTVKEAEELNNNEIERVMKKGKIYGDPIAIIDM